VIGSQWHPLSNQPYFPGGKVFSAFEIGIQHILLHHSLGVKKRSVDGDGVGHHVHETFPIVIEKGNNGMFQLVV
jgi:hypothetical protein